MGKRRDRRKRGSKAVSLCLSLILLISAIPMSATAEEPVRFGYDSAWHPTDVLPPAQVLDILDYDAIPEGEKPEMGEDSWLGISNAAGLKKAANYTNGDKKDRFLHINYCLTADIDLSGVTYTPMANAKYSQNKSYYKSGIPTAFSGVFDGQGHCIRNLSVSGAYQSVAYVGLFGALGSGAKVRNLVFDSSCCFFATGAEDVVKNLCVGTVAGRMIEGASIENVYSAASVSGGNWTGGIVGRLDPTFRNGAGSPANAIARITVANSVMGGKYVGGVAGAVYGNAYISLVRQNATVEAKSEGAFVGGIIGFCNQAYVYNQQTAAPEDLVSYVSLSSCINLGNLSGTGTLGGLFGKIKEDDAGAMNLTVSDCLNQGYFDSATERSLWGRKEIQKAGQIASSSDASSAVRLHGVQFLAEEATSTTFTVRFVGSIQEGREYSEVGFFVVLDYDGGHIEKKLTCKTVFTSLSEGEGSKTAKALRGEEGYLFAVVIEEIPKSVQNLSFTVTPYAKGLKTGEETGVAGRLNCREGVAVKAWE